MISDYKNQKIMQEFATNNLPDLDICVLAALELFSQIEIPEIEIPFKRPLVVGSGNAAATGKIIFEKYDAVFADESTVDIKLNSINSIDGVVLISASGAKHAPIIAKKAKEKGKQVVLITNTKNSMAEEFVDRTYVFPKNREPYTYNTSTYMGMILGLTKEDSKEIYDYIKNVIDKLELVNFSNINAFYFIVPEEFSGIIHLLKVKFIELFGRRVAKDIDTFECMRHATTVVPTENEIFIDFSFDERRNNNYGKEKNRIHVPLPKNARYAAMMAIGYYIIGKIQSQKPAWFKEHLQEYMDKTSKDYGYTLSPVVE